MLDSLHAQLRVLAALAPAAVTMLDLNACDAKSGDWMRDAASASVPPGPTSFFTIHEVFEDEGRDREIWLHTHGLSRMGMQRMARERLPRFLALQGRFAKSKDWEFGVKLGVPIDSDAGAESREHLWFDVHDATAETVDATLANRPYAVASMSQGQRGTFDLRLLTDWVILSPRGKYTPETVLQLERGLANDVPARSFLH